MRKLNRNELRFSFARSSGPGGQNVNKVNSKAVLHFTVRDSSAFNAAERELLLHKLANRLTAEGDIVITSDRSRDQRRNIEDCIEKLETLLAKSLQRPRKRVKTKPTRAAVERRITSKRITSRKKKQRKPADAE